MPGVGALCLACGLCCDGTLFAHASLAPDEAVALATRALPIVQSGDGRARLRQPCRALDGTRCTIYAARPQTCRDYDCDLVNALRENELDETEALEIIRRTKAMRAGLLDRLPPEPSEPEPLRHRISTADAPAQGGPLPDDTWHLFHSLEDVLDHSFRGRRGR